MAMRTIGIRLRWENSEYNRGADQAIAKNQKLKGSLETISSRLLIVGGALTAVAGIAVFAAAKFDKAMSEVQAVTGASADEMGRLRQAALDAGAATVFSAGEAAQAEAELAKAGIATADILGGALSGSLDLAAAGSLDLATSAEIAAAAMNTFGLEGKDVGHIADVLAAAANKSAAGVDDLGQGLQQVGLIANQVGFTLDETVGLLAAFADAGLKGSDGATSLKTALLRLAAPQDEAADLMAELGISLYDTNGNMVDAATIAGRLQTAFTGLAPAQRNAALQTIFGSDAIRSANILLSQGESGIRDYITAVNDQGAAARMAQIKMDNLAGDVENLTGSLETLFIQSGSGAQGGLRSLVQSLTGIANAFGRLPPAVQSTAVLATGFLGIALLTAGALIKLRLAALSASTSLIAMGGAATFAGRSMLFLTQHAGLAAAAIILVTEAVSGGQKSIRLHEGLVKELGKTYGIAGNDILDTLHKVDDALALMASQGRQREAMGEVEEAARRAGVSVDFAMKHLPKFAAASGIAAAASGTLANAFDDAAESAQDLERRVSNLNNEVLTMRGATRDAEAALDDLADALDESNGSMDITTKEGRAAAAAFDDVVTAADQVYLTMLDQTGSVEGANAAYRDYIERLKQTMRQAGHTEAEIQDLINKIQKVPGSKTTTFNANAGQALSAAAAVLNAINRLHDRTISVYIRQVQVPYGGGYSAYNRWGGIATHAAQGLLSQAHVAAPVSRGALYAYAEPETGGEAFIPRRGNRARSLGILKAAAGWLDSDVVPRDGRYAMGGAGSGPMEIVVSPAPGSDQKLMAAVIGGLRFQVRTKGAGNVQTYLGPRR